MKFVFTGLMIFSSVLLFAQVTLLEENFDGSTFPNDFSIIDNDGNTVNSEVQEYTEAWILKEDPTDASNGTASSTSFFEPVDRADRWLITPQILLGTSGNFISWKGLSHDPSFPDSYKVMISKTGNSVADFTDTLTIINDELPTWTEHTASLDSFANEQIYIAFVNTTFDGFKLYLDSIYVREQDPLTVQKESFTMSVYPNPASKEVNLVTGNENLRSVKMFNSYGEVVIEEYISDSTNKHVLNLQGLANGIYYLSVRTTDGISRKKLTIFN